MSEADAAYQQGYDRGIASMQPRIATLEAQVAALAAALADILAQGVSFDDVRLDYVEMQIPRDVLSDAREVLSADSQHLAAVAKTKGK